MKTVSSDSIIDVGNICSNSSILVIGNGTNFPAIDADIKFIRKVKDLNRLIVSGAKFDRVFIDLDFNEEYDEEEIRLNTVISASQTVSKNGLLGLLCENKTVQNQFKEHVESNFLNANIWDLEYYDDYQDNIGTLVLTDVSSES